MTRLPKRVLALAIVATLTVSAAAWSAGGGAVSPSPAQVVNPAPIDLPLIMHNAVGVLPPPTALSLATATPTPAPSRTPPASPTATLTAAASVTPPVTASPSWQPYRAFGQRALSETAYNEVVPNRVFHPAGVVVDRMPAPTPSRLYVWDAGNNRILGLDHVGTCVGGANRGQPCTENSSCGSGSCTGNTAAPATLVFGQPDGTGYAACNGDNTRVVPAGADTLCAVPYPYQISPLEGARGNSMAVDGAHNLYAVDPYNNRVLRFDDPFGQAGDPRSAVAADQVWGQADFAQRLCNRGRSEPSADSLCTGEVDRFSPNYYFAAGLDVTADGRTLWVADLGNHRVLRIPTTGNAADLVIGQPDMRSRTAHCTVPYDSAFLCKPNSVRYDEALDRLYVLDGDAEYARVLVFDHPARNGQAASSVSTPPPSGLFWARGLTLDPFTPNAYWVTDTDHSRIIQYVGGVPTRVLAKGDLSSVGCIGASGTGPLPAEVCNPHGTIGIDRDGSVYASNLIGSNVVRYPAPIPRPRPDGLAHSPDCQILKDDWGYGLLFANHIGPSGLANPAAVTFVGHQLVVADRKRLVFWDDYAEGPLSGGNATGVLVQADLHSQDTVEGVSWADFNFLAHDATRGLLYASHSQSIWAWRTTGGLRSGQATAFRIERDLPVRGGGRTPINVWGMAIDEATDSAWLSDADRHRLIRVLNFSRPDREVDAILGQSTVTAGACNRGQSTPVADGFCIPTQVKVDQRGDLYVVDGTWEGNGNRRVVAYARQSLPPIPSPQLVWPAGTTLPARVYAKASFTTRSCDPDVAGQPCAPRSISFEPGTNRMFLSVDAYTNPLLSRVFVYDNTVPPGLTAPRPSGTVPLPFNQPSDSAWDASGRLAILDHTWNRVILIRQPPPPTP